MKGASKASRLRIDRSPSLTDLAANKLTEAIVSGHFKPGHRLLEIEMSHEFGISRAPLREAMRVLAGEGLVEIRQSRGCYVTTPSDEDMEKMIVLRALLEGTAARVVAFERDPATLREIGGHLDVMRDCLAKQDDAGFHAANWEYHSAIIRASRNKFVEQSWGSIKSIIKFYLVVSAEIAVDKPIILKNLTGFFRAMRECTPEEAEAVVRSQIIWMACELVRRPIPKAAESYVTHLVDDQGDIRRVSADDLRTLRPQPGGRRR